MLKTKTYLTVLTALCIGLCARPAAASELLDEATVQGKLATDAIASVAADLAELKSREAAEWKGAKAGGARLVWGYVSEGRRLAPSYWLVAAVRGSRNIGLVGLDPHDGHLAWRAGFIPPYRAPLVDALLAGGPGKAATALGRSLKEEEQARYKLDSPIAVSVNGVYYWLFPTVSEDVHDSMCVAVGGGDPIYLWQAVATGLGVRPAEGRAGASGPPIELPAGEGKRTSPGTTWLMGKVPLHSNVTAGSSWAAALTAVRQWWSPISLGTVGAQSEKVYEASGKQRGAPVYFYRVHELMNRWPAIDGYGDFATVWLGRGLSFDPERGLSWKSNDPRAWLAHEAPLFAAVDADGLGPEESADQVVVIVGYSPERRMVYVNNPWGLADAFSYADFNTRFWGAWFSVKCGLPSLCATRSFARHGMVGAVPGDLQGPATPRPLAAVPRTVSDSLAVNISSVGVFLAPPLVGGFGGKDPFGEDYVTECLLRLPRAAHRGGEQTGGWSTLRKREAKDELQVVAASDEILFPGMMLGGAQFNVSFASPDKTSDVQVTSTCTVHDLDDRTHFQGGETIQVEDDSQQLGGSALMPRPGLISAATKETIAVSIRDEDPAPPSITLLSARTLPDSQKGAYRFKVAIRDWSKVDSAGLKWDFEDPESKPFKKFPKKKGDEYWVDIPRKEWLKHVGGKIYFKVMARDADSDWEGDQSSSVAEFEVAVVDDDGAGPAVAQYVVERKGNNQFQVLVKLEDASGVLVTQAWPMLYYSFSEDLSLDKFNGKTKLVKEPKYGTDWFTAVAPWGEEGIEQDEAHKGKMKDTVIFFKVRAMDLDDDRTDDAADSWSPSWWEVYLPGKADSRVAADIWPGGEDKVLWKTWDHWFDPPPLGLPAGMFIETPPGQENPPPMPDLLAGKKARVRLHFYLPRQGAISGGRAVFTASSPGKKPFKAEVSLISRKGVTVLGVSSFPTEDRGGGEVTVKLPVEALSTGENILVIEPSGMSAPDRLRLERILIEY